MSYPVSHRPPPQPLPDVIDASGNIVRRTKTAASSTASIPMSKRPPPQPLRDVIDTEGNIVRRPGTATSNAAYIGRELCVECLENPPSAGTVHAQLQMKKCCGQLIHATHKSDEGKCAYSKCPSNKAQDAAIKTANVAASAVLKPVISVATNDTDIKTREDDRANVKTEQKNTSIDGRDEQIRNYARIELTDSLIPIREKASDLLPLLVTYERIAPGAFKQNETPLLNFLNAQTWNDGEQANLQKSFNQFKDISNLTLWQKIGYDQVNEFLNPSPTSFPPLAYAYVPVEKHRSAKTEVVVKPPSFVLPAGLTVDGAKKMFEELFKGYEEGKVSFEHLKTGSNDLHKFLADPNNQSKFKIEPIVFIVNVMIVQPSSFLEKLTKVLVDATGDDLYIVRGAHRRVVTFKVGLKSLFDKFIKTLDNADFDKLIAWSEKYKAFDSISYLQKLMQEFMKSEMKISELSDFFSKVVQTPANQALIAAFKPIVDQAKQDLEVAKVNKYSYAVSYT